MGKVEIRKDEKIFIIVAPAPVFIFIKVWSLDVEQPGQNMNEHLPHPGRHLVCFWGAEVNIQNQHSHTYTETSFFLYKSVNLFFKIILQ